MMRGHRKTIRLRDYDYSDPGGYFLTICTHSREELLGKIVNQEMRLSGPGEVVRQWWLRLEERFPDVELDSCIIMPNHIHGIVIILEKERKDVGALHELPLQDTKRTRRRMVLPRVVGYFKMNSAKQVNRLSVSSANPLWQRNHYEHVIRNQYELSKIREYIENNPAKWDLDRENPLSKNFNLTHRLYWKDMYDPVGAIHELPLRKNDQSP